MRFLPLAMALTAMLGFAGENPRMVYSKSFPGSTPAYVEITLDPSGAGTYKEAVDDDPEPFTMDAAATREMFDLAGKLGHFSRPLESGLKVANMGAKSFRWEDGAAKNEVKFNYSMDEDAKTLYDWFEKITESERLLAEFKRAVRHDRLGVNEAVVNIQASWERKRLARAEQFLPLLDQVAKNEIFMHMARERAAQLAEAIRAAKKI